LQLRIHGKPFVVDAAADFFKAGELAGELGSARRDSAEGSFGFLDLVLGEPQASSQNAELVNAEHVLALQTGRYRPSRLPGYGEGYSGG
jgi:hypothetical protein